MNIFFTSDLHINHSSIIHYCNRPFDNVDDMNIALMENWNKVVKTNDLVYILGDFIWNTTNKEEFITWMNSLNGRKILIKGNHCRISGIIQANNYGFEGVYESVNIKIDKHNEAILSHYPHKPSIWRQIKHLWKHGRNYKYIERRKKDDGKWLIHGHDHGVSKISGKKSIRVNVEAWDYRPVHINEIRTLIYEQTNGVK